VARKTSKQTGSDGEADGDDALHPGKTYTLFGHREGERAFLSAFHSGSLHHAWLITGEAGIGKATFAYGAARYLLHIGNMPDRSGSAETLHVPAESLAARQVASGAHPSLFTLKGDVKSASGAIGVDEVRKLRAFLGLTSPNGWRAAIVDATNDLTINSANALLKAIEEPPPRTVFFLIAQGAASVIPTIRSRCVKLSLRPLGEDDFVAALSAACKKEGLDIPAKEQITKLTDTARGSPGNAIALLKGGAVALAEKLDGLMSRLPKMDYATVHEVIASSSGARNAQVFERVCDLIEQRIEARAIQLADSGSEGAKGWAELWSRLRAQRLDLEALNLDKGAFLITAFSDIEHTAREESLDKLA